MPSGYTAKIRDDQSFKDFVMGCARAFGACITTRDDDWDKPIPIFKASDWHSERKVSAKKRLLELKKISRAKATRGAERKNLETFRNIVQGIQMARSLKTRYLTMLSKVQDWEPPTSDHDELKKFMENQISKSIPFDCDETYYQELLEKDLLTGKQWLKQEIAKAQWNIKYHQDQLQAEVERVDSRNKWVEELRDSLR